MPFPRNGISPPYVKLGFYGHSMFMVQDDDGTCVVTDPYDPSIGYEFPDLEASVVLISHGHYDHANAEGVKGNPAVLRTAGRTTAHGVEFEGLATAHDDREGRNRGSNLIFSWNMAGLDFAHFGDLGHRLGAELTARLRGLDVLFIPVGGNYTIDDVAAADIVNQLAPRLAVPMHYKTPALGIDIQGVEPFTARFHDVIEAGRDFVYLNRACLPESTHILLLDHRGQTG